MGLSLILTDAQQGLGIGSGRRTSGPLGYKILCFDLLYYFVVFVVVDLQI